MPMLAMYGVRSASSRERPSTVVSTSIAASASPLGFSANSHTRPSSSILINPKSEARDLSTGRHATVTSAPFWRCAAMNCV